MTSGTLHDVATALTDAFSQDELPSSPSALDDLSRSLQAYVTKNRKGDADASSRLQDELRSVYSQHIETQPKKLPLFMTVLKHLRPVIIPEEDLVEWFNLAVTPFVQQLGAKRVYIEDAQHFVVQSMVYDEDASDAQEKARTCARLANILLDAYMTRTRPVTTLGQDVSLQQKGYAAQQLQTMLVAFGRKKAKDLFLAIDNHLVVPETRFQALGLLAIFVEQQQAHLYTVVHTPIVEHLLKSLMNDTATIVVSAALRCLIMLLPHIPATVATQLPRLFLVYSRCLCWEKFSASSTKAQRDLVTDERVRRGSESEDSDDLDPSIDPTWTALHSLPDTPESSAPELLHYFTYLYALYPLNFMAYVRKPRKYLKNIEFPGADEFDLDQTVIRSRTEQFQRLHLLHPSFFNTTVEDELTDNRWSKADPSEIIAECHNLYVGQQVILGKPGPPPAGRLPAPPRLASPSIEQPGTATVSPTDSQHTAPRTVQSETAASEPGSPSAVATEAIAPPDSSHATPAMSEAAFQDLAQLQSELMLLRNELTFERYLKQQHVAAIAQLRRNHIKAVTIEAETATLINSNRALQKKLGDATKFNEKMQKETQARRTHTKQSEEQLTSKIRSLKADLTNQESIQRDLAQACKDCEQLRQLLVESEARELAKGEELESLQVKTQETDRLRREVSELTKQKRMLKTTQFQADATQTEQQMIKQELDNTRLLLKHQKQQLDRSKRAFQARIIQLETQLDSSGTSAAYHNGSQTTAELQEALTNSNYKLVQIKKAYAHLLDDHIDLKIKYNEAMIDVDLKIGRFVPMPAQPRELSTSLEYRSREGSMKSVGSVNHKLQQFADQRLDLLNTYQEDHSPIIPTFPRPPPDRPVRPDAYQYPLLNSSSVSRSGSTAFTDGASATDTTSWTGFYAPPEGEYGSSPSNMGKQQAKDALSVKSEDGSLRSEKAREKSDAWIYGRVGAQNLKPKDRAKSVMLEKPAKLSRAFGGFRGLV